jgi:hypothetical protein
LGNPKPSNWRNWKLSQERPPLHGSCQTPACNGVAEKKFKFSDGGYAHFCLKCWHTWTEKASSGIN